MKFILSILFLPFICYAQPKPPPFARGKIKMNSLIIDVELAKTLEEQRHGLMYRKDKLGDSKGMLFIYKEERPLTFWMKNTFIPLSIAFFDKNRILINTEDMKPVSSIMETNIDISRSLQPAMFALEMDQGWFKKHKIVSGQKFDFEKDN